jgi:hypothetical protein
MLKSISHGGPGFSESIFIAEEPIGKRCSVVITNILGKTNWPARVSLPLPTTAGQGAGISIGGALSGLPCRVVTNGVVSGVIVTVAVNPGDALMVNSSGQLTKAVYNVSAATVMSGVFSGTIGSVGKIIAKSLMSGAALGTISVMVIGGG